MPEVETDHGPVQVPTQPKQLGVKTLITVVLVVLSLVTGVSGMNWMASMAPKPVLKDPAVPSLYIDVFELSKSNLQELTSAFGTAKSDRDIVMTSYVTGEIVETFNLEVGEKVRTADVGEVPNQGPSKTDKGDIVIQIDKRDYEQKRNSTEDRIKEQETELNRIAQEEKNLDRKLKVSQDDYQTFQKEYDRLKGLSEKQIITQSALSSSLLELRRYEDAVIQLETEIALLPSKKELAQRKLTTLRNDLKQSIIDLGRTSVIPPFTGVISEVYVEKGQYVRAGDQLFRMVDMDNVLVRIPVSQSAFHDIEQAQKTGEPVRVLLGPSESEQDVWFGYVVRFSPTADERTRTVDVFIEVDNSKQKAPLLPGTFVMVKILGETHREVVAIPRDAVVENKIYVIEPMSEEKAPATEKKAEVPAGNKPAAAEKRLEKYTVKSVPVTIVDSFQTVSVITGDIKPGDKIVITNLDKITEMQEEGGKFTLTINKVKTLNDESKAMKIPMWQIVE